MLAVRGVGLRGAALAHKSKVGRTKAARNRLFLPLLGLALLGGGKEAGGISSGMNFASAAAAAAAHKPSRDASTRTITLTPPQYDSVVVIAHGLGDSAEGFADVAQMFAAQPFLAKTKFILPTAPNQPVTLNGGMSMNSWYDIEALDLKDKEKCNGIIESRAIIEAILDDEHDNHGVPYKRMVLGGFSQGGALSIFTGLQLPKEKKLAGLLCMSGYLASYQTFQLNQAVKDTPVLHCHGQSDEMVGFKWALSTKEKLLEQGATAYELRPFPGMGHTVIMEELQVALRFIEKCLGASEKQFEEMDINELQEAIQAAGLGDKAVGLLEKKHLVDLLNKDKEEL